MACGQATSCSLWHKPPGVTDQIPGQPKAEYIGIWSGTESSGKGNQVNLVNLEDLCGHYQVSWFRQCALGTRVAMQQVTLYYDITSGL